MPHQRRSWRDVFQEMEHEKYVELRKMNHMAGGQLSDRKLRRRAREDATRHVCRAIRERELAGEEEPIAFAVHPESLPVLPPELVA